MSLSAKEGLANARAGRAVAIVIITATAWLCAGIGMANAREVSSLVLAERSWIQAGGFAFIVEAARHEGDVAALDPVTCERLASMEGIDAAFAVQPTPSTLAPGHAQATDATLFEVSAGAYHFLGVDPPAGAGVIVTDEAAADTGIVNGETTTFIRRSITDSGPPVAFVATATVVSSPILAEAIRGSYLLPSTLPEGAAACYVQSDAAHAEAVALYLRSAFANGDGQANVSPRLSANTYGLDFATAYQARVMRWSPFAGAAALAAMWAIVQWTRRTRTAIYATFGAPSGARMLIQVTEWAALSGIGAAFGWAIALAASIGFDVDAFTALTQVTGSVAIAWLGASIAAVAIGLIPVGTLLDALKDRS